MTVECAYWRTLLSSLPDAKRCATVTHIIYSNLEDLDDILKCVFANTIVDCVIRAYEEWHVQPECDLVLKRFDAELVRQRFIAIAAPSEPVAYGVLCCLEEMNRAVAASLGATLSAHLQSERVRLVISELANAG
jgi:hypothetical protein